MSENGNTIAKKCWRFDGISGVNLDAFAGNNDLFTSLF